METNKKIIRNLKINVVDTNEDHIKIMYSKFTDQDDFVWAYVFANDVDDLLENMNSPVIYKHAFFQVAGKSKDFNTGVIFAISNDIDNYVLLDFFHTYLKGYEEYKWEPTEFGESFPENHTMYFALFYDHTMYDMDGNLLGKIFRDSITGIYWNLDELEKLESEVDWFKLREVGYSGGRKRDYVPGNGDTVYPEIEITSEEHAMIKGVYRYHSMETILKNRLGDDISRFYDPDKDYDDDDDDF